MAVDIRLPAMPGLWSMATLTTTVVGAHTLDWDAGQDRCNPNVDTPSADTHGVNGTDVRHRWCRLVVHHGCPA